MIARHFPFAALILLGLAACEQSPEAAFDRGCQRMAAREDGSTAETRDAFCDCLSEATTGLSEQDMLTLGDLMTKADDSDSFRAALREAGADGTLSAAGATSFLSGAKTCALRTAL